MIPESNIHKAQNTPKDMTPLKAKKVSIAREKLSSSGNSVPGTASILLQPIHKKDALINVNMSVKTPLALAEAIVEKAQKTLNNEVADKLLPGRRSLLELMAKDPTTFVNDLGRMGQITIGINEISKRAFEKRSPGEIYNFMSNRLVDYIRLQRPDLPLDRSIMDELLYCGVQTFMGHPEVEAMQGLDIPGKDWQPLSNQSLVSTNYKLEEKSYFERIREGNIFRDKANTEVIVITRQSTKTYSEDASNPHAKNHHVLTEVQIKYNLASKVVAYFYRYSLDEGHPEKSWKSAVAI